ncbi:hypothetical protein RhiirC2_738470, partial [Rhizophagus irregularis]
LILLFESNRIQITYTNDDPVVHILDRAHISPPYVISSIECNNEIILQRVKEMMVQLPI